MKIDHLPGDHDIGLRASGEWVSGYVAVMNTRWAHPQQCQEQKANAQLLALSFTAIPTLIALVRALEQQRDEALDRIRNDGNPITARAMQTGFNTELERLITK